MMPLKSIHNIVNIYLRSYLDTITILIITLLILITVDKKQICNIAFINVISNVIISNIAKY
jgi:hypothetical protein